MMAKRAQGIIQLSKHPGEAPASDPMAGPPLGRRVFRPRNVASFLLALVVLYLVYRQLLGLDWPEVWASTHQASASLLALAFAVFYCSFFFRALRWKALLANVGYDRTAGNRLPSALGLSKIMYLAWFANCVTIARLGDAYRCYLLKKEAAGGVSFTVALGTVVAERLLDLVVMATMVGAGVLVVFGGSLPAEVSRVVAIGLLLSVVGIVGLVSVRRLRGAVERVLPKGLHTHYARLEHGLVDSFGRLLPMLLAYTAIGWLIEGATLYVTAAAVGAPISAAGALAVALGASLLTTVPFTPAGLGFTETGLVLMLGWLGLDASTAGAVTLLFRLINYWSIVVFGLILYFLSRNGNQLTKGRLAVHD